MTVPQEIPVTSLKYGRRQQNGQVLQQWLEASANAPNCHVQHSNLDMSNLFAFQRVDLELKMEPIDLVQLEQYLNSVETGGPKNGGWHRYCLEQLDPTVDDPFHPDFDEDNPESWKSNYWQGQTDLISQILYEEHFPMNTLKYVYMVDVQNEDTLQFVKTQLYQRSNGVLDQEGEITERYEWEYGTPEFDALLGTTLGKHVAYLLLSAFIRGTRRICRVRTWFAFQELQMEFMLEEIEATHYLPPPGAYASADKTWFGVAGMVVEDSAIPNFNQVMPTISEDTQAFIPTDQFLAQPNHFLAQPEQSFAQDQSLTEEQFLAPPTQFLPPPNPYFAQHTGGW